MVKLRCRLVGVADAGEVDMVSREKAGVGTGILVDADSEHGKIGPIML